VGKDLLREEELGRWRNKSKGWSTNILIFTKVINVKIQSYLASHYKLFVSNNPFITLKTYKSMERLLNETDKEKMTKFC
jgi:hypothetical protein